ncbi:hypothetical protein LTR36_010863 [Oleoguttula mirabilis]|uniref:HNH nuclease domain-containing protein n=1 Tax=Oleoguttula mirabilis TaxID=1507867 RepID=A0AAV9J400_9PEZI|nr:hypothetical protein LTR36_010863 [Oleoguttula mirabilis]
MSPKVKWIVLTGGLFCNDYLRRRLHEDYHGALGIAIVDGGKDAVGNRDLSVVRGWLARAAVRKTEVPTKFGWGIVQEEPWDPKVHTDVEKGSLFIKTGYRGMKYVPDRWEWLIRPRMLVHNKQNALAATAWRIFFLSEEEPFVRHQIYWTALDLKDHFDVYSNGVSLMDGVHEWDEEHSFHIPEEELRKYPAVHLGGVRLSASKRYAIWARLEVVNSGLDVRATWHIAPPKFRPYAKNSKLFNDFSMKKDYAQVGEASVNDEGFGSFLQRSGKAMSPSGAKSDNSTGGVPLPIPSASLADLSAASILQAPQSASPDADIDLSDFVDEAEMIYGIQR